MIKSFYYGWIFKRDKPRGTVIRAETLFYDQWTGELKESGEPFCEIQEFLEGNLNSVELLYKENTSRSYHFEWKDSRLISIREVAMHKEYLTHFHYDDQNLLKTEERFLKKESQLVKNK